MCIYLQGGCCSQHSKEAIRKAYWTKRPGRSQAITGISQPTQKKEAAARHNSQYLSQAERVCVVRSTVVKDKGERIGVSRNQSRGIQERGNIGLQLGKSQYPFTWL